MNEDQDPRSLEGEILDEPDPQLRIDEQELMSQLGELEQLRTLFSSEEWPLFDRLLQAEEIAAVNGLTSEQTLSVEQFWAYRARAALARRLREYPELVNREVGQVQQHLAQLDRSEEDIPDAR